MGYLTIRGSSEFEFTEKKSTFIGRAFYTPTEEDAKRVISEIRMADPEARHHVFAYVIHGGITRMSDDGEPSGTGGAPTLNALQKNGFQDVTVVVTRHFGGILLGAGGLVRAYAKAAAGALDAAEKTETAEFITFTLSFAYSKTGTVTYHAEKLNIPITDRSFADRVVFTMVAEEPAVNSLKEALAEDISIAFEEVGRHIAPR
ncbi:MAG: YigZ family protein [Clostridia bacterium]|nr:YigZ family protein [Clostridia bacterium]